MRLTTKESQMNREVRKLRKELRELRSENTALSLTIEKSWSMLSCWQTDITLSGKTLSHAIDSVLESTRD